MVKPRSSLASNQDEPWGGDELSSRLPRGVRLLIAAMFLSGVANRTKLVALGLLVYRVTGREFDLGLLGLAEFGPLFLLSPFTGTLADRFDRRKVFAVGLTLQVLAAGLLAVLAFQEPESIGGILAVVVLLGVARSITMPAGRALPIDLAPTHLVERTVALRSVSFQTASIIGPAIAGLLFAASPPLPFVLAFIGSSGALGLLAMVPSAEVARLAAGGWTDSLRQAVEGVRYIARTRVLLGAITLDLFAVLFGGAVALLPAIGEKRLGVDEAAVGVLYSSIGVGALVVAAILSVRPVRRHVGLVLFGVVAVFGAATVVLGLTTNYVVALIALVALSGADAVSVFIRSTIVPLASPEDMRGRVLAVEGVFISGSNELGAMESGLTAAWFGLAPAVVLGGFGTLGVVAVGMLAFPALRKIDRFADLVPDTP